MRRQELLGILAGGILTVSTLAVVISGAAGWSDMLAKWGKL